MNAKLELYEDCSSDKPSKTYECKRLLLGVSKKVTGLYTELQKTDDIDTQYDTILGILKLIFPTFEEKELNYLSVEAIMNFFNEILHETNKIVEKSSKN